LEQQTTEVPQDTIQAIHPQVQLTSAEIASLWRSNTYYSMVRCISRHFLNTLDDPDLRPPIEYAGKRNICPAPNH